MRHPVRTAILIAILILTAFWSIFPPREKLRLGKDLSGGVSLVYSVLLAPNDDAREVMAALVRVLKERIDPSNQLDISFVPQGRDRIEITMPLPSAEVKALRAEVEALIDALAATSLSEDQFESLVRAAPDEREAQVARLAAGNQARADLLRAAAAAHDAAQSARRAYDEGVAAGAAGDGLTALIQQAGDAELAYDRARDAVLASAIDPEQVRRILELPAADTRKRDDSTTPPTMVVIPSPRARALERLRDQHPESTEQIDRIMAAWERYQAKRKTLDAPEDLVRMLRGAGVLEFRITVDPGDHPEETRLRQELRERGPKNVKAADVGWYKINRIDTWFDSVQQGEALLADPAVFFAQRGFVGEEYDGEYFLLCYDSRGNRLTRAEGDWKVARAGRTQDELGRPAISYEMDTRGASLQGQLTGDHVNDNMAVLLDDQIYTAPTLNERITKNGMISGEFPPAELDYIIRTLGAGSLQAKLSPEPISQDIVGPEMGLDNLVRSLESGVISFAVCAVFLMGYYFFCGSIAVVALAVNCLLLVGAMALGRSAFTLPGIAGVILTFAMAVDANVLIYERMREEITRGEDLRNAVRLGYQRALSAIVDGNLTNLIVCMVLVFLGTQEIRGFGITMTIGVVTTLFSQLVVTRLIFYILVEKLGWRKARMLPLVVPAVQRAFDLHIDWMRLRPVFYIVFAGLFGLSLFMCITRGAEMFDTEFRGGTEVKVQLKKDADGRPMTLTRQDVQDRLAAFVDAAAAAAPGAARALAPLKSADIVVVNPESDGFTSSTFKVKTVMTDAQRVQAAVVGALEGLVDAEPPLHFAGADADGLSGPPAFAIVDRYLGRNIDRPEVLRNVEPYLGGVALVLADLTPQPTLDSLRARLRQVRDSADFADTAARTSEVVVIDGDETSVRAAVVLVRDASVSIFTGEDAWRAELRDREQALVRTALGQATTLASLRSFSPAIAGTFVAQAAVSLVLSVLLVAIYVWVRFNSLRFSVAAILPTLLDCFIAVGLIAAAEMIHQSFPGFATALRLDAFKIDLTLVAAILTILGYSINDKIVVLDRIRENRGKLHYVSREVVNRSINQVISRTIMTGSTTIISTFVLYLLGGEAVRGFAYALGLGVIIGTFSSIALGAPLVWSTRGDRPAPPKAA